MQKATIALEIVRFKGYNKETKTDSGLIADGGKMKQFLREAVDFIKRTDRWLMSLCMICAAFSMVLLYSIYRNGFLSSSRGVWVQIVATILGIVVAIVISTIDYEAMAKFWKFHLAFTVFFVILTFFFGVQVEGADDKAWLNLGITTIQPSEFLKISFIVTFAYHLSKVQNDLNKVKNIILLLLHAGGVAGLIVIQGDYGTALIFFFIAAIMLIVAGLSWKYLLGGLLILPIVCFLVWNFLLDEMHRERFLVSFNPDLDPLGVGYQQVRGRLALGSGGLFGRGLFADNLVEVPEMRNDFIFSYIGQTLGFVGCLAVVILLVAICLRILYVSRLSQDALGSYICVGVFGCVFFQSVVNIAMVLCVAPVIGVTLPLFSSGGSSMLTMFMTMGLVLSVYHKNRRTTMFD